MLVATRPRAIEHVCDRGFLARGPVGCLHTFASARAVELAHELGLALVAVGDFVFPADGVYLLGADPARIGLAVALAWGRAVELAHALGLALVPVR